ncbi:MAG: hypothetical protein LLG00_02715 [Planctomycetaceae bacterium]|nr:hypothetical protein [Planctomycetaceae bacterium]
MNRQPSHEYRLGGFDMRIPKSFRLSTPWSLRAVAEPGLYHFAREADGATIRFHLRVDSGGGGLLVANGAAITRLSASGVLFAKALMERQTPEKIAKQAKRLFKGMSAERFTRDLDAVRTVIERMQSPRGDYPIFNLSDPAFSPKVAPLGRPISADVPLCAPFHAARIFDRLWEVGIPHVTIVVERDCNETHLLRAVQRASDLGLITGVRGRGTPLAVGNRIADMAAAGLDHLDVYCFSAVEDIHDALAGKGDCKQAARALSMAAKHEICAVAQLAIVRATLPSIGATLQRMSEHGIKNVAAFAVATTNAEEAAAGALLGHELPPAARLVEEYAERLGLRLIWNPAVRFDPTRPLSEQACRGPRCSGDTAIRVEADGTIFLPRGPWASAGNLIDDDWNAIERSDAYQLYRERVESDTHCDTCPGLAICAADCPREPAGWAEGWGGESDK